MSGLTHLLLTGNRIIDLSPLAGLTRLIYLYLGNNQVGDLSPLTGISTLSYLFLKENQITDLSPLSALPDIKTLDISRNQVSDLSPLTGFNFLQKLDARHNRVTGLPPQILDLQPSLDIEESFAREEKIYLYGNPLEQPPPEIIRQGKIAVREYFLSLEKDRTCPLREVKVLLVGDGAAGKTSLVRRLLSKGFDPSEAQTDGINIDTWAIAQKEDDLEKIHAHLWDFGGQEIMHATHQFFLSKRSLYILVLDGRRDEKIEYWLKHIESFGGDSPVLVVLNKIDQNPGFDVNRKFLKEKYKNIKGFFPLSCASGRGIDYLAKALKKELPEVELVNTTWPVTWFNIKERLENMTNDYISFGEYRDICRDEGLDEEVSQEYLLEFLHDLGVVLHFSDDTLEDTQVLTPEWATGAVYRIINSRQLAENRGMLDISDLPDILQRSEEHDLAYPKEKYLFIIGLMKKFELCYEVDEKRVLVPDLLAVPEPEFDFDYTGALRFIVQYDFLPRSVLPRFIVNMYRDIEEGLQWRTGVVLTDHDFRAMAVIKADYMDRHIYIYVSGPGKRDYFAAILFTLRSINSSFEKLKTKELVPLPDNTEVTASYQQLLGLEEEGYEYYLAENRKKYRVKDLLGTITGRPSTEEELSKLLSKLANEKDTAESLAKKVNDMLILKPNILGIEMNLNRLIDNLLARRQRKQDKNR